MTIGSATVVIPTYRRPEGLAALLSALTCQVDPGIPWDVIVVDNDATRSGPGPSGAVAGSGLPATIVSEPRQGASNARNRGIREARGDVVVFVDDDVVPNRDWLRQLVEPILSGRCDGTGGRVILDPAVRRPSWFDEAGLGPYLAAHAPAEEERPLRDGEYVITASAAFVADKLRAIGGFDPELGPRGTTQLVNDDVALGDAFVRAGGRLHHVPASVVVHELPANRLRLAYLLRRAHSQGRSDWLLQVGTLGPKESGRRQARWARHEVFARLSEGPWRLSVAVHAAIDVARLTGAAREAARTLVRRARSAVGPTLG